MPVAINTSLRVLTCFNPARVGKRVLDSWKGVARRASSGILSEPFSLFLDSACLIVNEAACNTHEFCGDCCRNLGNGPGLCVGSNVHKGEVRSVSSLVSGQPLNLQVEYLD
jgi:hypothetical protein